MPHDHHHHHDDAAVPAAEGTALLETTFIEGFRGAQDKASFLRLAGIPHELPGPDGQGLKLVEVRITDGFAVGAATPGFGTTELVYHPFPGAMVRQTAHLRFVYCSLHAVRELSWAEVASR